MEVTLNRALNNVMVSLDGLVGLKSVTVELIVWYNKWIQMVPDGLLSGPLFLKLHYLLINSLSLYSVCGLVCIYGISVD